MSSGTALVQALGVAYAAGINLPATIAVLGLVQHLTMIGTLPGGLDILANWWIVGLALTLSLGEFLVTLIPGIASIWETLQSVIRPPAAAALALATTIHLPPEVMIAAALLGGTLALTTHGTKLGLRYAVDTSPEPVTNFAANVAELTTVTAVCVAIWRHPYWTMALALATLVLLILVVRRLIRVLRSLFSGHIRQAIDVSSES